MKNIGSVVGLYPTAVTIKELEDENLGFAGETVEEMKRKMEK
ncbi:hypothetical protein Q428_01590 [Fervidicella metallireducens AeB]|uniref:Uncharacterized protein n=1 Tax=Fervidicella metallireducens AeB TaxID=1403537 RepID=A0A017RY62_9CLOT|nr:hypothetical protein [Fervidicella metallireducens]EYE89582.1 hypothetical protein Q428_01590 [Fervidicella metallireducens AeB]